MRLLVLDTHAWVWAAERSKRLSRAARAAIGRNEGRLVIADVSLYEAWAAQLRGEFKTTLPLSAWLEEAIARMRLRVEPVSPAIAGLCSSLGFSHGDPFDQIIVATALSLNARLVTGDSRIHESALVETIW